MFAVADDGQSDLSEASNWAEDAEVYSSDSQLSDWEKEEGSMQAESEAADADLAEALQLADHAIRGACCLLRLLTPSPCTSTGLAFISMRAAVYHPCCFATKLLSCSQSLPSTAGLRRVQLTYYQTAQLLQTYKQQAVKATIEHAPSLTWCRITL